MSSKKSKKRIGSTRRHHQGLKAEEREDNAELQESSSAEHLQPSEMLTCQLDSVPENIEDDQHDASLTCSEKLDTGALAEICEAETSAFRKKRRMGSTRIAKQEAEERKEEEERMESMQMIQEEFNTTVPEDQYLKEHSNTPEGMSDEALTQLMEEGGSQVKEQAEMTEDEFPNEQHRLLSGLDLKTETEACSEESPSPAVNLIVSVTGIHPNEEEASNKQDQQSCVGIFEVKEISNFTPLQDANQGLDQQTDESADVSKREEQWGAKDVNLESNIDMDSVTLGDNKQDVFLREKSQGIMQIEKVDDESVRETEVESAVSLHSTESLPMVEEQSQVFHPTDANADEIMMEGYSKSGNQNLLETEQTINISQEEETNSEYDHVQKPKKRMGSIRRPLKGIKIIKEDNGNSQGGTQEIKENTFQDPKLSEHIAHFIPEFTPQDVNQLQEHNKDHKEQGPESPRDQEGQSCSNMEVLEQAEVENKLSSLGNPCPDCIDTTKEDAERMDSFSHHIGFETLSSFEQEHLSSSPKAQDIDVAPPNSHTESLSIKVYHPDMKDNEEAELEVQASILSYTKESEAPSSSTNVLDLCRPLYVESIGTSETSTLPDHSESSFKLKHHEEEEVVKQGALTQKRRMGSTRRTKREHKMEETCEAVIIEGDDTTEDMKMNSKTDVTAEAGGDILKVEIIGTSRETEFVTNQKNVDTPNIALTLFEQNEDTDKSTTSFPQCNVQEHGQKQENQYEYPDIATEQLDDNDFKDNNEISILWKETASVATNQTDVEMNSPDVQPCEEEEKRTQSYILIYTSEVSNICTVVPDFSHSAHLECTDTSETSTFPDHSESSLKLQHHDEAGSVKQGASRQKRRMGSTRRTNREQKMEETSGVMSTEIDDGNENMDVKTDADLSVEAEGDIIGASQETEFVTSQTEVETLSATLTPIEQDQYVDSSISTEIMSSSIPKCSQEDEQTQESQHQHFEATAEQLDDDYLKDCNKLFGKETVEDKTTVETGLFNEACTSGIGDQLQGHENDKLENSLGSLGSQNLEDIDMVETKLSPPTEDSSPDSASTTVEDRDTSEKTEYFSCPIDIENVTCLGSLTSSSPDKIPEIAITTQQTIPADNSNLEMHSPDVQHSEEGEQRAQIPILSSTMESDVPITADVSDFSLLLDHEGDGSVKQGASRQKRRMGSTRRTKREHKMEDNATEDMNMNIDADLRAQTGGDVLKVDIRPTSKEAELVSNQTNVETVGMASSLNEKDQYADSSISSEIMSSYPQENELKQQNQHQRPDINIEQLDDNELKDDEMSIPRQETAEAITTVGPGILNDGSVSEDGDQFKKHDDENLEKSLEPLGHLNIEDISMKLSEQAVEKILSSSGEDFSPDSSATTVENMDVSAKTESFSCQISVETLTCLGSSSSLDPLSEKAVAQQCYVSLEVNTPDVQHSQEAEQGTQVYILSSTMESEAPGINVDISDSSYSLAVESTVRSETDPVSECSEYSLKLQHHEEEEGVKQGASRQKKRMGSTRRAKRDQKMEETCEVLKETIPEQAEVDSKLSHTEETSPDSVATTVEDMDTTEKTECFSCQIDIKNVTCLGSLASSSPNQIPETAITTQQTIPAENSNLEMYSPDVQHSEEEEQRTQVPILSSTMESDVPITADVSDFSLLLDYEEDGSVKQGASRQKRRMGSTRRTKREHKMEETCGVMSAEGDDATEDINLNIDADLRAQTGGDVLKVDIILTSKETELVSNQTNVETVCMASNLNEKDQYADSSISSEIMSSFPQEDELKQENQHQRPDINTEQLHDDNELKDEMSIPRQETAEAITTVGPGILNDGSDHSETDTVSEWSEPSLKLQHHEEEEGVKQDASRQKRRMGSTRRAKREQKMEETCELLTETIPELAEVENKLSSTEDRSPDSVATRVEDMDTTENFSSQIDVETLTCLGSPPSHSPDHVPDISQQNVHAERSDQDESSFKLSNPDVQQCKEEERWAQSHIESSYVAESDVLFEQWESCFRFQHHEKEGDSKQDLSKQKRKIGSTHRRKRESNEIHLDSTKSSSATEEMTKMVTKIDIETQDEENLQSEQIPSKMQAACLNATPTEEEYKDYQTQIKDASEMTVNEDMSSHEKPFLFMEETPDVTISLEAADVDSYTKLNPNSCSPHDNQIVNQDTDVIYCPENSEAGKMESQVDQDECASEPAHLKRDLKATPRKKIGSTRRVNRKQEDKKNISRDEEKEEIQTISKDDNQMESVLITQYVEVVEAQREEGTSETQREVQNNTIAEEQEIIEGQNQNTVSEKSVTVTQYQETEGSPGLARRRKLGSTRKSRKEQTERKYVMDGMLMYTDTETDSTHDGKLVDGEMKENEEKGIHESEENTEVVPTNTVVSPPESLETIQEMSNNDKDQLSESANQCILSGSITTAEQPRLVDMVGNDNGSTHGDTLPVNSGTPPTNSTLSENTLRLTHLEASDSSEESKPRKKRMGSSRKKSQHQHKDKTENQGVADVRNDDSDSVTNTDKPQVEEDTGGTGATDKAVLEGPLNDKLTDIHESEYSEPASEVHSHPEGPSVTEFHDQSHLGLTEISGSSGNSAAETSFDINPCADDSPKEHRSVLHKRKMGSSRRGQGLGNRMKGAATVEEHVEDINTLRQATRDDTPLQSTEDLSVEGKQLLLAQSSKSDQQPLTQGETSNEVIEERTFPESAECRTSVLSASSSASSEPQEDNPSIDSQSNGKKRKMGSTRKNMRRHGEDTNSDLMREQAPSTERCSDDTATGDMEVPSVPAETVTTQKMFKDVQPEDIVTQDESTGHGSAGHKQDSDSTRRKMGSRRGGQGYRGIEAIGAPEDQPVSEAQDSDRSLLQGTQGNVHCEGVPEQGASKHGSQREREIQKLEQPPSGARSKSDLERDTLISLGEAVMFNVVMVGDSSVGKTSFIRRLERGQFYPDPSATLGVDTSILTLVVDDKLVKLQIWDTAGQERFHSITRQVLHKAQGLILMYDISSCQSFSAVRKWIACIEEGAPSEVIIMLLGNKNDSEDRQVLHPEGKRLAEEYNIHFMECSAVTGYNVSQAMETLARLLKQTVKETDQKYVSLHKKPQQKKSGCC